MVDPWHRHCEGTDKNCISPGLVPLTTQMVPEARGIGVESEYTFLTTYITVPSDGQKPSFIRNLPSSICRSPAFFTLTQYK